MLNALMKNAKNMLNRSLIPFNKYHLSKDSSRIFFFFKNENIPKAMEIIEKVFGIYSFSPALRTSNNLKNITERAIEVGNEILKKGDTFAIRVKRSGKHDFSSQDVAVKVGQAIRDHFNDLELKVNLSNPYKKIYIEVRDEFSYIFTDIIKSKWGGLPTEFRKKILVIDIGRTQDLLAGFLLMRRGAQIYPILFDLTKNDELFEKWISNWKEVFTYTPQLKFTIRKIDLYMLLDNIISKISEGEYVCAICRLVRFDIISKMIKELNIKDLKEIRAITDGVNLNNLTSCFDDVDLESIAFNYFFSEYPIFTPIIGLGSSEIKQFLKKLSPSIRNLNYCRFKPKNQEIDAKKLKSLYDSLDLNELIKECMNNLVEIKIS